jgi:chloride channel protein, CIC family
MLVAVIAALMGLAFKNVLYKIEDWCDALWKGRPEWTPPVVLGLAFGLLLLALPQMYGVGYPVMFKATAGNYTIWFLVVLALGKILATSVSMGIGGSGGIFAPSLFIGVTTGMAYGGIVDHLFGASAGQPALYAVVAMGAVFTSAARAPLTSLASVVEMTGDFSLTLPVMLAVAIATTVSRSLSYGTIYTTKLLRRGTDIDQAAPWRALQDLKITDVMRPFPAALHVPPDGKAAPAGDQDATALPGTVDYRHDVQALFAAESLGPALRQLAVYGRDGLPVVSADEHAVEGWVTSEGVLRALAHRVAGTAAETAHAQAAAGGEPDDPQAMLEHPSVPLPGYQVAEITITGNSPAAGRKLGEVSWPPGSISVLVLHGGSPRQPHQDMTLAPGDRVSLLIPVIQDSGLPDQDSRDAELPH